ncbi:MAG: hypothetical protein WD876_03155 [Candidatus Pacearchaeota archaeon]
MEITKKEADRKRKIDIIREHLKKSVDGKSPLIEKEFINLMCYDWGISPRSFKEYLNIAMWMEDLKVIGGKIIK